MKWVYLLGGGLVGTAGRYTISSAMARLSQPFPYHTLAVNTAGCLIAGFIIGLTDRAGAMAFEARMFWMTGLLGAFTTFSALIIETWRLLQDGQLALAGTNLIGSAAAGLFALWLGARAASIIPGS